uniref:Uncharacterized protein n=1 Tax=Panagrolaimus sp. PS1159 TaxID=55785 RepID=A0AC35FM76_9BILA
MSRACSTIGCFRTNGTFRRYPAHYGPWYCNPCGLRLKRKDDPEDAGEDVAPENGVDGVASEDGGEDYAATKEEGSEVFADKDAVEFVPCSTMGCVLTTKPLRRHPANYGPWYCNPCALRLNRNAVLQRQAVQDVPFEYGVKKRADDPEDGGEDVAPENGGDGVASEDGGEGGGEVNVPLKLPQRESKRKAMLMYTEIKHTLDCPTWSCQERPQLIEICKGIADEGVKAREDIEADTSIDWMRGDRVLESEATAEDRRMDDNLNAHSME